MGGAPGTPDVKVNLEVPIASVSEFETDAEGAVYLVLKQPTSIVKKLPDSTSPWTPLNLHGLPDSPLRFLAANDGTFYVAAYGTSDLQVHHFSAAGELLDVASAGGFYQLGGLLQDAQSAVRISLFEGSVVTNSVVEAGQIVQGTSSAAPSVVSPSAYAFRAESGDYWAAMGSDFNGTWLTLNGKAPVNVASSATFFALAPDGAGGWYVSWSTLSTDSDTFAKTLHSSFTRYSPAGLPLWSKGWSSAPFTTAQMNGSFLTLNVIPLIDSVVFVMGLPPSDGSPMVTRYSKDGAWLGGLPPGEWVAGAGRAGDHRVVLVRQTTLEWYTFPAAAP